jgi:hypothetical protein
MVGYFEHYLAVTVVPLVLNNNCTIYDINSRDEPLFYPEIYSINETFFSTSLIQYNNMRAIYELRYHICIILHQHVSHATMPVQHQMWF